MPAKHHSPSPPTPGARTPVDHGSGSPPDRPADTGPPPPATDPATSVGRIPVLDVRPLVRQGRRPAKAVTGESFEISATVFREGHDAVAANVVLRDPEGRPGPFTPMRELAPGTDRWGATVTAGEPGPWTYTVEAWGDPVTTWRHHAQIKVPAGMDTELMLEEGARLYERAAAHVPGSGPRGVLLAAVDALRDERRPAATRLAGALTPEVDAVLARHPLRELVTSSDPLPLLVERERALYGAWYEFFPRSEGTPAQPHGTFDTAARRLPAIAAMGFDVVYLPPIHPIGTTFRKGPNNTLGRRPRRRRRALGDRLPRGRPRRRPPPAGHPGGLHPLRAPGRRTRPGGGPGLRPAVLPGPPLGAQAPRVVPPPPRRLHRPRREPAQEVPGHLPRRLRRRPRRPGRRDRPGPAALDGHRRADLPRRQPPHQTRALLGTRDRRGQPHRPRRDLPRRGVHPPRDDAHPGPDRLPAVLHLLHLAQHQAGTDGVPHRTLRGRRLLHAAQLLRQHPRHPARLPPARRPARLRGPRRPRRHPLPHLGHLQRLRTLREHPPARRQRGVPRQREIPAQTPRLGHRHPRGPHPRPPHHPPQHHPARRTRPCGNLLRNLQLPPTRQRLRSSRTAKRSGLPNAVLVVANLDPHHTQEATVSLDMPQLGLEWHESVPVRDELTGQTYQWGRSNYVRLEPGGAHVLVVGRESGARPPGEHDRGLRPSSPPIGGSPTT